MESFISKIGLLAILVPVILNTGHGNKDEPTLSGVGTPEGTQVGGARDPEIGCPTSLGPLILVHGKNRDFTNSYTPTLWFSLPFDSSKVTSAELSIHSANGRNTYKRFSMDLQPSSQGGLYGATLPNDSLVSSNTLYRWNLNIFCRPRNEYPPSYMVENWIVRLEAPGSNAWYDKIHQAVQRRDANFFDQNLELDSLDSEEFLDQISNALSRQLVFQATLENISND